MKTMRISALLALALLGCSTQISRAVPMSTAFTYQGFLNEGEAAADGLYDLEFRIYDSAEDGSQLGGAIDFNELDVIEGYFEVKLDFGGGIFQGDPRWLQIGVRPGEHSDPRGYTLLSPRQKITPAPYALYAETAGGDGYWGVSGTDMHSLPTGNVGIGTTTPIAKLEVMESESGHGIRSTAPGIPVYGHRTSTSGTWPAIHGECDSLARNASAVRGELTSTSPGSGSAAVRGINNGQANLGIGVWGSHAGSGYGVYGTASGDTAHAVHGKATGTAATGVYGEAGNAAAGVSYGGYFTAAGSWSQGVHGQATGLNGAGVQGEAAGSKGRGVFGIASSTADQMNYGGHFSAFGKYGQGVHGKATGTAGRGVHGEASYSGDAINYGGYFEAGGTWGQGVHGEAPAYGGYFIARGDDAHGVHGVATADDGTGVYGKGGGAGVGVYGEAPDSGGPTYSRHYGGYFLAEGYNAIGVEGRADNGLGVYGYSSSGTGVHGSGGEADFYAPHGTYESGSSIRWKRDVRPIDDPLAKVSALRGVYFNWDSEHGGRHAVGMIAEEVGRILPEIVTYEENGIDARGIDYSKLTPLLVEAVKAMKEQVDQRERWLSQKDAEIEALAERLKKVELLQRENADLYSRIEKLETMMAASARNSKGDGQ